MIRALLEQQFDLATKIRPGLLGEAHVSEADVAFAVDQEGTGHALHLESLRRPPLWIEEDVHRRRLAREEGPRALRVFIDIDGHHVEPRLMEFLMKRVERREGGFARRAP